MSLFTDDEVQALMLNFLQTRGKGGATEEEIVKFINICTGYRGMSAYIDLAIRQEVSLDLVGEEVIVRGKEVFNANGQWN